MKRATLKRRADSVHNAVRVDVDELSKAILPVEWPNEPTFHTSGFPLSAQRLGVGDLNVYNAAGPGTVLWVLRDEVQLHPTALDEPVLRGLVPFRRKAQAPISGEGGVEVVNARDRSDAFEDRLRHNREER